MCRLCEITEESVKIGKTLTEDQQGEVAGQVVQLSETIYGLCKQLEGDVIADTLSTLIAFWIKAAGTLNDGDNTRMKILHESMKEISFKFIALSENGIGGLTDLIEKMLNGEDPHQLPNQQ